PLAQVHVARVELGPGVHDRDDRLALVVLGVGAELAHPGAVAERAQPVPAVPAVAPELLGCPPLGGHVRPQPARILPISSRMFSGSSRLGGRTSRRARPSWASASLTTLTLSAEASAARSSSNARHASQIFIAPSQSPPRSVYSMPTDSLGFTLTRPEVKPRAP